MSLTLQPVTVGTGHDEEGLLVFTDEQRQRLVAVLTRLSDQYDSASGHWFLETGFGPVHDQSHPTFPDLDHAQDWIERQLSKSAR